MTIHLLNCFTDNARWPSKLKTGMACLLIETDQGPVLLDTGLGLGDYANPTWMTRMFRIITIMPFDLKETAVNRIKKLGYAPENVKHIILTHMHFDHISGLPDFPQAKVHVHRREYEAFTSGKIRQFTEFAYNHRYIAHQPDFILYDTVNSKWYDFDAIRLPFSSEMYFILYSPLWTLTRTVRRGGQKRDGLAFPRCRRGRGPRPQHRARLGHPPRARTSLAAPAPICPVPPRSDPHCQPHVRFLFRATPLRLLATPLALRSPQHATRNT